jgi:hypothetical protein
MHFDPDDKIDIDLVFEIETKLKTEE